MTDQHPITPPPDLLKEWIDAWYGAKVKHENMTDFVAIQAARWGADQELEACCEWLLEHSYESATQELHYARRPKPQSLKEQALELVNEMNTGGAGWLVVYDKDGVIRRALEQLDD